MLMDASCPSAEVARAVAYCLSAEIGADTAASTKNGQVLAEVVPRPSLRVARSDTSCLSAEVAAVVVFSPSTEVGAAFAYCPSAEIGCTFSYWNWCS